MEQAELFSTDHDAYVLAKSRDLAESYVEKMEDPDRIKELIRNAEDIIERAKGRYEEVWSTSWNKGFKVYRNGVAYTATWLKRQHKGLRTRCHTCDQLVDGEAPRLRVTNGPNGVETQNSKGVVNEYNCTWCAEMYYGTRPPKE